MIGLNQCTPVGTPGAKDTGSPDEEKLGGGTAQGVPQSSGSAQVAVPRGKKEGPSLQHLDVGGQPLTDKKSIVNLLASTLEDISSAEQLNPVFQKIKSQSERRRLDFRSEGKEDYNVPFSLSELKEALKKSKDSAVGPDNIHYQFLKRLPESGLNVLLNFYNTSIV